METLHRNVSVLLVDLMSSIFEVQQGFSREEEERGQCQYLRQLWHLARNACSSKILYTAVILLPKAGILSYWIQNQSWAGSLPICGYTSRPKLEIVFTHTSVISWSFNKKKKYRF